MVKLPRNYIVFMGDGEDIYVLYNKLKIAKRGTPGTPQADTWVSLEPGYSVVDGDTSVIVFYEDAAAQ